MQRKRSVTKEAPADGQPTAESTAPRAQKRIITQAERAEVEALIEREPNAQTETERAEVGNDLV